MRLTATRNASSVGEPRVAQDGDLLAEVILQLRHVDRVIACLRRR